MAEVKLNRGFVTLVDDDDEERVNEYNWNVQQRRRTNYAYTVIGRRVVSLHRYIFGDKPRLVVDHINGNGLDNRKKNLRWATVSQNQMNARKPLRRNGTTSRYRGVSFRADKNYSKPWGVRIYVKGRRINVGYYADEEAAAKAYDKAAKKHHGEFANLNFDNS